MALRSDPEKTRKWQQDSARRWHEKRKRSAEEALAWRRRVYDQARRSGWMCQAKGMHTSSCPGHLNPFSGQGHHVHPKSWGGDDSSEVLWVHPDCHARIHSRTREAIELGYLTRGRD